MDEIDFLPEAYRKKCQQRHWIMRRIHISVCVACVLIVAIGYDQHSIRNQRLRVIPRQQHQLATLENSKMQHEHVRQLLSEAMFKREQLFLPLLRISRSRLIGEALSQMPEGSSLNSIGLVTQPEIWVGSTVSIPKDQDPLKVEMNRLVEIASASELRLSLMGSAQSMEQVNLLERRLGNTNMFSNIKLQETRQNGPRVDFSLLAIVVNPYHQLMDESTEASSTLVGSGSKSSDRQQFNHVTPFRKAAFTTPRRSTISFSLQQ